MFHYLKLIFILIVTSLTLQAQFDDEPVKSKASLLVDHETIAPGSTFTAALHLHHPEAWHSYYRNSGGIELSPEISWTLPEGFTAGHIQWPTPKVKDGEFGTSFIYQGNLTLLVDITAPEKLETGSTVDIKADAQWQICETGCINEEGQFELKLPVAETATLERTSEEFFKEARAKLPVSKSDWSFDLSETADSVTMHIEDQGQLAQIPTDFIPDQGFVNAASKGGSIVRDGNTIVIQLPRQTKNAFDEPIEQGNSISGIILGVDESYLAPMTKIGSGGGELAKAETKAVGFGALITILGGMFIGGLILNLMPCVFPVIGLKIMGFVQQSGEHRNKVMLHGAIFTLGVLASFALLSGILFAARSAAGDSVGWGYQLQNPWVVLSLMLLMFVLALNMFGLFEIGASATSVGGKLQSRQGLAGSFFSGILATVVATPCSAPFLGAAIGAAIALPAAQFFCAFAAMALGLSTPYLVLSIFPRLIDFLPRPGAWMESFKQAMSFLLFATAGYLLWVYAGQIGLENLLNPIFGLSAIAIAAWIHGRWNAPSRPRRARLTALILTLVFTLSGLWLTKPPEPSKLEWKSWTPEVQSALLEQGTPVYIDFTAQWCLTCQVNKKRAYNEEVIKAFKQKGIVALKADKTKPNEDIDQAVQSYGRAAIPVNVLLIPGQEPIILPELLGPKDVLEALEKIEDE